MLVFKKCRQQDDNVLFIDHRTIFLKKEKIKTI
ncbi:hypothetical protein ACVQ90_04800 [Staphylococcus aureus]